MVRKETTPVLPDFHAVVTGKVSSKDTNPKDSVGVKKAYLSTVPVPFLVELGIAMLEGALKYGRHNYLIAGVRASVYYDAIMARHMPCWWEGEDIDPDSGLSHLTKAAACLVVMRSAQMYGKLIDDRPPHLPAGWLVQYNEKAAALIDKYPDPKAAYTFRDQEGFQEDMAALGTSVLTGEAFRAIGNGADSPTINFSPELAAAVIKDTNRIMRGMAYKRARKTARSRVKSKRKPGNRPGNPHMRPTRRPL